MNYTKAKVLFVFVLSLAFVFVANHSVWARHGLKFSQPKEINGFKISVFYIQAVKAGMADMKAMDMKGNKKGGMNMPQRAKSDIHLETVVEALENNPLFLKPGQWVPYLDVRYRIKKVDTGEEREGVLMPMFAKNGIHYGNNVKMMGIGKYKVTIIIGHPTVMMHTDKETKAGKLWEPFEAVWDFKYFGPGKKGGY